MGNAALGDSGTHLNAKYKTIGACPAISSCQMWAAVPSSSWGAGPFNARKMRTAASAVLQIRRRPRVRLVTDARRELLHLPSPQPRPARQSEQAAKHSHTCDRQDDKRRHHASVIEPATCCGANSRNNREPQHSQPDKQHSASVALDRSDADPVSSRSRLEMSLQVAIGPLTKCAVLPQLPAGVESVAQVHDESIPFLVGQLSIEIYAQPYTNRQPEKRARHRTFAELDRLRCLRQLIGCDPHLTTDLLELRERHSLRRRKLSLSGVLRLRS